MSARHRLGERLATLRGPEPSHSAPQVNPTWRQNAVRIAFVVAVGAIIHMLSYGYVGGIEDPELRAQLEEFRLLDIGLGLVAVIVFFASLTAVLFHLGLLQFVVNRIGRALGWALGTGRYESVNAAANIFVGQTEAPQFCTRLSKLDHDLERPHHPTGVGRQDRGRRGRVEPGHSGGDGGGDVEGELVKHWCLQRCG